MKTKLFMVERGVSWNYNCTLSQPWKKVKVYPSDLSIGQQLPEPTDNEVTWAEIPV